ncbi:MAG TPA: penicillin-binding transpeptidase domain-containing protein [Firmicutes bacterium]|nr:penicillin-binding transpeptidase domain-containing protein [Bacillota bacterium]
MKKILPILIFCIVLLTGCQSNAEQSLFTDFEQKMTAKDYSGLYSLLSTDSQLTITEEDFITRYENIYSGIGATDIKLTMGEIDKENKTIPFSLSMETIAGTITRTDFTLPYIKEEKELKITWSESLIFPMMQTGDKVRVTNEKANRGTIYDRNNQVLASDGALKTVGIHPAVFDTSNRDAKITEIAKTLDISEESITKKLDANTNPDHFVPLVDILPESPLLLTLSNRESDGIILKNTTGRVYYNHEAFGRLLGYVGSITAEELKDDVEQFYKTTSKIGKAGLEQVYETTLRGTDGIEIYIERDDNKLETLAKKDAQHGENITLSIDSTLQMSVYNNMNGESGSAAAISPTTGEILALVSSPSYNSNRYTTYITQTEQEKRVATNYVDEANRFARLYSPGSTFKLITAATGLETGAINPNDVKTIIGSEWQKDSSWGNYNIRRINSQTSISLKEALKYSDNIYFGMSALNIGSESLIKGAQQLGIGTTLDIGYPIAQSQISNSGSISSDIALADTGYGQAEVMVTSLNMALAYSALSNNGNIMNPTLILGDSHPISLLKEAAISPENLSILQEYFVDVVEDTDGTGHLSKIDGIQLAGKTGTAEIKQAQGETGSENGWFVATDIDHAKISIAVVVEEVQDGPGTLGVVSMVKNMLEDYLK